MSDRRRMRFGVVFGIGAMCLMFTAVACSEPEVEPVEETTAATSAQVGAGGSDTEPVNDRPNPYETIEDYFTLPEGRTWGATSAVDVDIDGTSIWVGERCGANGCADSDLPVVLKFDADGNVVTSFGGGMFIFPHGIHVDADGNVWITDAQGFSQMMTWHWAKV